MCGGEPDSEELQGAWSLVGLEFEDLAEPGGGAGVDEEGAILGAEVLPVSAAKRGQTVDGDEALVPLPPGNRTTLDKAQQERRAQVQEAPTCRQHCSESTSRRRESWPPPGSSRLRR